MVKKILVVDDEPGVAYTVKNGLEEMDSEYTVITVESGMQCLEYLTNEQLPDLILLDIMMPKMTGWETLERIKENMQWRGIPIIFLTARTDNVAKRAGGFLADDYIGKPFQIPSLKRSIHFKSIGGTGNRMVLYTMCLNRFYD
jgi:CheY-like chemotaxis protein